MTLRGATANHTREPQVVFVLYILYILGLGDLGVHTLTNTQSHSRPNIPPLSLADTHTRSLTDNLGIYLGRLANPLVFVFSKAASSFDMHRMKIGILSLI